MVSYSPLILSLSDEYFYPIFYSLFFILASITNQTTTASLFCPSPLSSTITL
ncbi:uncharacterized protein BDW47DRAFT_16021 [Aspergillus candidus]|uniref:Uncharacterized protein n=1 Tax=Aspergillus candidus TaxID=41067 RepID=A0A2I2FEK8_ASPCN|nr:hypothetical protein BDW47DRAFT_16021 [Aspergillus candidus]PLB39074.1 hypothetical protein BDW47DRAFT_16021 [Aspergillus candidus]